MTNAERYAVLNKARRVLDEMAEEDFPLEDRWHGITYARITDAEAAVFDALNARASFLEDADASRAIVAYNAGTDQDPEADEARRLSEGGPRTASDGEHAADNARAISEGTL